MCSLTEIRPCTTFASTQAVLPQEMTGTTTAVDFTKGYRETFARLGYTLNHGNWGGWTVVHKAAACGNEAVLCAIFQECGGKKDLLSLGSKNGLTPLHSAVGCDKPIIVHTLIAFGSPINLTTIAPMNVALAEHCEFSAGATPLDIALRIKNLSIIIFLRVNGGKCAQPLLEGQKKLLDKADSMLALMNAFLNKIIGLYVTKELLGIIAEYAIEEHAVNYLSEFS